MNLSLSESCSNLLSGMCRLGFAGFMFFLIKGLLWLAIPYFAHHAFG